MMTPAKSQVVTSLSLRAHKDANSWWLISIGEILLMIIDRLQTKESPGSFLGAIMAEAGCLRSNQLTKVVTKGQKLSWACHDQNIGLDYSAIIIG